MQRGAITMKSTMAGYGREYISAKTEAIHELELPAERSATLEIDILQNIQAVAWTVTPDGRMDFINQFYLEATGLELEACIAPLHVWNKDGSSLPPFLASLHPEHKERIRKRFWD